MKRIARAVAAACLFIGVTAPAAVARPGGHAPTTIQILNVSDWHAQFDPMTIGGQQVGGAAVLSSYFEQHRAANPNTLTITAGDAFGASPPLSNFFDEIPAVLAMNAMGFSVDGLGNHNFDRGVDHLQQMIDLAEFPYVSANLANVDDELDGVKPYEIFEFDGVEVAVIGVTNPDAPTLVFPGSFGTIEVTDPVAAVTRARRQAKREGADVFVVIAHMGVTAFDGGNPQGPIVDLANGLNPDHIDLVIGDHTNVAFNGVVNGIPLVENLSKGAQYSRIDITVDTKNGNVQSVTAEQLTPFAANVVPDPDVIALLAPYRAELQVELGQIIGTSAIAIPRSDRCGRVDGRLCESLVGNVVTDAMRTAYGTDFALTNSGGLRDALTCPAAGNDTCAPYSPPPFNITKGQAFAVLPFGNQSATVTVTGAELKAFLERGVSGSPAAVGSFAQVSGLCFTYDVHVPPGSRVTSVVRQAADGTCTTTAVDLTAGVSYSLATNDFVASGGDGYPVVISRATTRNQMDQDLRDYVAANSPLNPTIQGRIVCTSSGATACPAPPTP